LDHTRYGSCGTFIFNAQFMMTVQQRNLAILEYNILPRISNDVETLEKKFLIECRKSNRDEYLLRVYFTRLLMLVDELKDSYRSILEQIIERQENE